MDLHYYLGHLLNLSNDLDVNSLQHWNSIYIPLDYYSLHFDLYFNLVLHFRLARLADRLFD